jgi:hypothetical protein
VPAAPHERACGCNGRITQTKKDVKSIVFAMLLRLIVGWLGMLQEEVLAEEDGFELQSA